MLLPQLRQINPFWLNLLAIIELALPFYLLIGVLHLRLFISERLNWKRFPTAVPLILMSVPAVTVLHEHYLGKIAVLFAIVHLLSFVLVGMRAHILFEDCALPFEISRQKRAFKTFRALQIFWWLQAPAAAFNGLNWPRGLLWTQATIAALAITIVGTDWVRSRKTI